MLSILNTQFLINLIYSFSGPVSIFLYLSAIYMLMISFQIMPDKIIGILFPSLSENYLSEVDQSLLSSFICRFRKIYMFVTFIYKMVFIRVNILVISGCVTLAFGLAILSRVIPVYILMHIIFTILVLKMAGFCSKLHKSKESLKKKS